MATKRKNTRTTRTSSRKSATVRQTNNLGLGISIGALVVIALLIAFLSGAYVVLGPSCCTKAPAAAAAPTTQPTSVATIAPTQAPAAPAPAVAQPTNGQPAATNNDVPSGTVVTALQWTNPATGALNIENAMKLVPEKICETNAENVTTGVVYQFASSFKDNDPKNTYLKQELCKIRIAKDLQPYLLGVQGDASSPVQVCFANGGSEYNILWMKMDSGNGTSVLIKFEGGTNPPSDQRCSASQ